ncbi:MAG: hypothetical protein AAGH99_01105 [Planctomycetota bacterium]
MAKRITDIWDEFEGNLFHSRPRYSQSGDCIFYYLEDAESYAERVDEVLTVYRAFDDDRTVGFQIKGISALLAMFGDFGFELRADVDLSFLLIVGGASKGAENRDPYKEVMPRAMQARMPIAQLQHAR